MVTFDEEMHCFGVRLGMSEEPIPMKFKTPRKAAHKAVRNSKAEKKKKQVSKTRRGKDDTGKVIFPC